MLEHPHKNFYVRHFLEIFDIKTVVTLSQFVPFTDLFLETTLIQILL